MALDYSTLSDAELEAIANEDYSKLSDVTLQAISSEASEGQVSDPQINMAPQAISVANRLRGAVAPVVQGAANMALGSAKDIGKLSNILYNNLTPGVVGQWIGSPVESGKKLVGAYVEGHPWMNQAAEMTPKQVVQSGTGFARNIGSKVLTGLAAPESAFLMPYQMAAYEREKIRANPTAPEYATTPYAQFVRGEYATPGAAAGGNRREAVANIPYGRVTPEEKQILDQDRLNMAIRLRAARRVLAPVSPTGQ